MSQMIRDIPRPTAEQLKPWVSLSAATAHEALGRRGAVDSAIKPVGQGMRAFGPAVTCICEPSDNLTLHAAMKIAREGDVIVCDAGGYTEQGLFGDVMATSAQIKGIAGLVVDGGVRDAAALRAMGFPVFSRSICMRGTVKETMGPINVPIVFGGVHVSPGDLVIADDDGVCIVPMAEIDEVTRASIAREEKEARSKAAFTPDLVTWDVSGWSERLRKKGMIIDL
jgi:4-hydroxy-4-methyl-2-oxoglutarate aldolase